jgi:hypothetical protein
VRRKLNLWYQRQELKHPDSEKATFSDQHWLLFGEKPDFPGDFRMPNLTMWENLGLKFFHRR